MRIAILGILLGLLFNSSILGQTYFNKNFDLTGSTEIGSSVATLADGSYAGITILDNWGIAFVKYNNIGDTIFTKRYLFSAGSVLSGFAGNFQKVSPTGYIFTAPFQEPNLNTQMLFLKFDDNGDTLCYKRFNFGKDSRGISCRQTSDGNYILIGAVEDSTTNRYSVLLLKLDQFGNPIWHRTLSNTYNFYGNSVDEAKDRGFIIGASMDHSGTKPWVIKTDSLGSMEWQKTYGSTYGYNLAWVSSLSDGNFALASGQDWDNNGGDSYLAKLDSQGNILWDTLISEPLVDDMFATAPVETSNGSIVVANHLISAPFQRVYSFSNNGEFNWMREHTCYSGLIPIIYDLRLTMDGGFVTYGDGLGSSFTQDTWIMKLDSMGCDSIGCQLIGIEESKENIVHRLFPNPGNNKIHLSGLDNNEISFMLFSIEGRRVASQLVSSLRSEVDVSKLNTGLYFYLLTDKKGIKSSGKWIKY